MNYSLRSSLIVFTIAAIPLSVSAEDKPEPESYLIVQHAGSATMAGGTLTLKDADANMVIFTDRPHRIAAAVPSADLLKAWVEGQDSFADDPPNAALVGQSEGKPVSIIVELTDPKQSDENISFSYTVLDGPDVQSLTDSYIVIDDSPALFFKGWADLGSLVTGDPGAVIPFSEDIGAGPGEQN
ncbi:hypothetical protein ABLN87_15190 [Ruegeria sp. SCPT10]|uniref:hypothetical protein n=1 Tax=Ruegeria sp. SCP10 TaxID=3141377 RepID=UPI00333C3389